MAKQAYILEKGLLEGSSVRALYQHELDLEVLIHALPVQGHDFRLCNQVHATSGHIHLSLPFPHDVVCVHHGERCRW
jgi:hypothetical protein